MADRETMRAIVVRAFGGPEVLQLEQLPVPEVSEGDLLVEVVAAGVNPVDVSNHEDGGWAGISVPYTPGSDVSGIVRAVGSRVSDFAVGDEVFALTDFLGTRQGSYAELQAVPASLAAHKPAGLTHAEAASLPLAAGTAYEVVVRRLDVRPSEHVVIFGASGGVGGFATQIAARRGADVIGVARPEAYAYLDLLGATAAFSFTSGDAVAQIESAVGKVDVLVDLAGGRTIETGLTLIREGGRAASIASLAGDLELAIDRNITIHGVLVRPDRARLVDLARMVDGGTLRTTIRGEYDLVDAPAAHREVTRGGVPGKTVLRVRPEPSTG